MVAFLFMKIKFIKYVTLCLVAATGLWFYFQISTYPYKVDRWLHPLEAGFVSVATKHCSPGGFWLGLFVNHAVNKQGAYSAQVAFVDDTGGHYNCEIGYKDNFFGTQTNASHRYRYASTTKLLTNAAILNLVIKGKIQLNHTLVNFFPELTHFRDERVRSITIADLLNHTAGFDRRTLNGDPMFLRRSKPWCPYELGQLGELKLSFEPGKKQVYSNVGYCLLGEIIARVSRGNYRDYMEREFSLIKRNIRFVNNYYYDDEVRYDYRYEEWYNDSYLKLFDFNAISSIAGLSGSATALAQLLSDIHHDDLRSMFALDAPPLSCNPQKVNGCLVSGIYHYQPEKYGLTLHYHQGYLPGSVSVAVVDSFGGVTVLVKSGANRVQSSPRNEWIPWIYERLNLHYTLQGKLPILKFINPDIFK